LTSASYFYLIITHYSDLLGKSVTCVKVVHKNVSLPT
jgi:hypothetical protein